MLHGFRQIRVWLAVALLASASAWAQNSSPTVAQLQSRLTATPASEQSPILAELSRALESVDPARALELARQARTAAANPREELIADSRIASVLRRRGDYTESMRIVRAALKRATEIHDEVALLENTFVFAQINWSLTDYPSAIASYQQTVTLAEALGNRYLFGRAHLGIAIIYAESGESEKAKNQEEIALKVGEELDNGELQADALNNLGNTLVGVGDLAQARTVHERALKLRTDLGNRRGVADSLVNLGNVFRLRQEYTMALDYTQQALVTYEELGLKRNLANTQLQFAQILRPLGRLEDALTHLRTGFALAEVLASHIVLANFHREFATIYEAQGNWHAAYDSERKFATEADAALGEKVRLQLAALNARYDAERRQHEIDTLRAERAVSEADDARTRWQRFALLAAFGVGAAILAVIVGWQRLRLKAERRVLAEARAAQKAAEDADRLKTRFLGIASHDIRSPLNNVLRLVDELRIARQKRGETDERHDWIAVEVQRVLGLVQDLLDTAALESGHLELKKVSTDLVELTRSSLRELRWQIDAKRLQVNFPEPASAAGWIEADPARLLQVVGNLVSNAIKFTPPGRVVDLTLTRQGSVVRLAIRDEGPGISEADKERLFLPFTRLATHPSARETSHGLGLSIAQEITRLHGGRITVESGAGTGSTFVLELPVGSAASIS